MNYLLKKIERVQININKSKKLKQADKRTN